MIKRILKEEDLKVGKIYLCIAQNDQPNTTRIRDCSYKFIVRSAPHTYCGDCGALKGTRWVSVKHIYDWCKGESIYNIDSLRDMGITDKPHNNHKVYYLSCGVYQTIKNLSIAAFMCLVDAPDRIDSIEQRLTKLEQQALLGRHPNIPSMYKYLGAASVDNNKYYLASREAHTIGYDGTVIAIFDVSNIEYAVFTWTIQSGCVLHDEMIDDRRWRYLVGVAWDLYCK